MSARIRLLITALAAFAAFTLAPSSPALSYGGFSDVDGDAYYAPAVAWMKSEGVTTGITPGCYAPGVNVTRAQFVVMMWRAEGRPSASGSHGFADVTADWQQDAITWATQQGITTGTAPGLFSPDAPITRGDLITMMWREANSPDVWREHDFDDVSLGYQVEAIDWAVARGVTTGETPREFAPESLADRGQAAVFLWRRHGEPNAPQINDEQCITPVPATPTPAFTGTSTFGPSAADLPAGYGENLALINANTASRFSRFDNSSPYRDTPQADLDIADFVTGSTNIGSGKRGIWHTRCAVSHFAYDDPIVYPNEPGLSHLHMFFGNTDANAYSNNSSINNSGSSTCGRDELNRTSYWMPALLDGADTVVPADTITVYYAVRNDAVGSKVQAFPPGLRMIAGSASDPSLPEGIYWQCGYFGAAFEEQGNAGPEVSTIPNCSRNTYSHVAANIEFPRCWDGVNLDSADHRSHMSYGSGGSTDGSTTCPASHPVELPQIKYRLMFNLNASPTATNTWYLASDVNHDNGTVRANHGSSLHADWWSGWHPETNQILVEGCLRDNASECLSDDIGDGRTVNEGQMRRYRDAGINMNDVAALCPGQGPITNITQIATCRHH